MGEADEERADPLAAALASASCAGAHLQHCHLTAADMPRVLEALRALGEVQRQARPRSWWFSGCCQAL